ncbi:hypothetical protein TNCT_16871 [Trichonephila clavata]|uniref:Uncharacterized protein n=1 Tax=Trichonephila clavata TaxID=2740835 RepID=A0A8X6J7L7_TRICU|nr:hypothetical protein TNCT_16871 [Trichonephila clavata]
MVINLTHFFEKLANAMQIYFSPESKSHVRQQHGSPHIITLKNVYPTHLIIVSYIAALFTTDLLFYFITLGAASFDKVCLHGATVGQGYPLFSNQDQIKAFKCETFLSIVAYFSDKTFQRIGVVK